MVRQVEEQSPGTGMERFRINAPYRACDKQNPACSYSIHTLIGGKKRSFIVAQFESLEDWSGTLNRYVVGFDD